MTPTDIIFNLCILSEPFLGLQKSRLKWSVPHTEKSDYNIITAKKASETIKSDNVRFDCSSRVQKSLIESRKKNYESWDFSHDWVPPPFSLTKKHLPCFH